MNKKRGKGYFFIIGESPMSEKKLKAGKIFLVSVKIGIGASLAIYIAERLQLEYYASAGIIALLSILTTKWGTLKLSLLRIITFILSAAACSLIFQYIQGDWIGFGFFLFFMIGICEWLGLRSTVSVNAVIATHFLATQNFSKEFILNEFFLVLIGIVIAFMFNLFQGNSSHQKAIIKNMRYTEMQLQDNLEELACYLSGNGMRGNVWEDIINLEKKLKSFTEQAYEYQNNTWQFHPSYYIDYFEMRTKQYNILHNLHYEIKKIRKMPLQAAIVADYVRYLKQYVTEMNDPKEQIERLHQTLEDIKKEHVPQNWEEFEGKAKMYHILMDLEEFLIFKKRFVESLNEKQLKIYWNADCKQGK